MNESRVCCIFVVDESTCDDKADEVRDVKLNGNQYNKSSVSDKYLRIVNWVLPVVPRVK